jgi:hypothetical protein
VRVRGEAIIEPFDHQSVASVVSELVECWRELRFEDGIVVLKSSRQRRAGLRLIEGHHPEPGARYQVVIVEPVAPALSDDERAQLARLGSARGESQAAIDEWLRRRQAELQASGRMQTKTYTVRAQLLADDDEALRLRFVVIEQSGVNIDLVLDHPRDPRGLALSVNGRVSGKWLTRGPIGVSAIVAREGLPPADSTHPLMQVDVRHRHALGGATLSVRPTGEGTWKVVVQVRGRASGLLRPPVALATPWLARVAHRRLRSFMAELPQRVEDLNRSLHVELYPDGPRGVAERWLQELLSSLPTTLPSSPEGSG